MPEAKSRGSAAGKTTKNAAQGRPASQRKTPAQTRRASGQSRAPAHEEERRKPEKTADTRGIWACVCLLLGVFSALGYSESEALVIRLVRQLFTGLLGWGFYALPPALVLSAVLLVFGQGKRGARLTALLLLPVTLGALYQLWFVRADYEFAAGLLKALWTDGGALQNGGVLGGLTTVVLVKLFSAAGAAVFFVCLLLFLTLVICNRTIGGIADLISRTAERRRKEWEARHPLPEEEPEREPQPIREPDDDGMPEHVRIPDRRSRRFADAVPEPPNDGGASAPEAAPKRTAPFNGKRFAYDLPVDDVAAPVQEPDSRAVEEARRRQAEEQERQKAREGFFRKTPGAISPDQYLNAAKNTPEPPELAGIPMQEPAPAAPITAAAPAARPVPSPAPVTVPRPEPRPVPPIQKEPVKVTPVPPAAPKPAAAPAPAVPASPAVPAAAPEKPEKPEYVFPPLSLLNMDAGGSKYDSQDEIRANKERLETALRSFGVNSSITNIIRGPTVTRYEMELEAGVKLNKITNLADDLALSLGVSGVRIAAVPNRQSTVGMEVPNKHVSTVYLREIIDSPAFQNASSKLTFAIGKNIGGEAVVGNISKLPHMLVAGTTGSGKSVALNSLILSILYKARPDEVKFIMVDPKMVEFRIYNGIPQLLVPVVTEAKKAAGALQWAVVEMMKRYKLFSETGARDISSYNEMVERTGEGEKIYSLVIVIDELADLMLVAPKDVEEAVCRVAQMGRAAGVHLVIATQSPRADVITGLMKANIPSRIALKVASSLESRIILDAGGNADKLVGNGDMLYAPIGSSKPTRIQGTWVSDQEREDIVNFIKNNSQADYNEDVIKQIENSADKDKNSKDVPEQEAPAEDQADDVDELYAQAVDVVIEMGQASVSMLQRRLKLGYSRAARLVDQMEERGIVGPFEGAKPRQVLLTKEQWQEMQFIQGTAPVTAGPAAEEPAPVSAPAPAPAAQPDVPLDAAPPEQTVFSAADLFDDP